MITRFLSAMALFLLLLTTITAQNNTIDFDNPTLAYTVTSTHMGVAYGCEIDNRCLVASAGRGDAPQRVMITISFPQVVEIRNVRVDYMLTITGTPPLYTGGVWNAQVTGGNNRFDGTVRINLPYDGVWHTVSTQDNTPRTRYWQAHAPYVGNKLRIEFNPASHIHSGTEIRIDNIVIDYVEL